MPSKTVLVADAPDKFAVLTAMWILSCNDENPIMTYKSIMYRLDPPDNFNIKELVYSRGELFRRGLQQERLEEWRSKLIQKPKNRPSWIKALNDDDRQIKAIQALSSDDLFRSQFRALEGAPKAPIEIIDWGLQHIERLRKASMETKEQYAKSTEVRFVLMISMLNVIVSLLTLLTK